ncbi:MAG: DUF1707 domain-containing protein [Geodermatophilaceae bacterium]|nr:DUF1707 domain-containing protein [Geodermatophilaceae bacterium]
MPEPQEPSGLDIRIGHAEREVAVNRLQTAFTEGRLDVTEFDERVGAVYVTRTAGELAQLTADLPVYRPAAGRDEPAVPPRVAPKAAQPPVGSTHDNAGRADLGLAPVGHSRVDQPGGLAHRHPLQWGVRRFLADLGGRPVGGGPSRRDGLPQPRPPLAALTMGCGRSGPARPHDHDRRVRDGLAIRG